LELFEWPTDAKAFAGFEFEFANGPFVMAAPLFDHRDRLPHFAERFEETKVHHHVG
jgi:hypothetical protein